MLRHHPFGAASLPSTACPSPATRCPFQATDTASPMPSRKHRTVRNGHCNRRAQSVRRSARRTAPPPPSPPSLARIDESCGTCSPAPSGRNHGGHGSGHAAQDDAGKLGKRPPRAPGKAVNNPSLSLTLYRNYRVSISRHETGRGIRSTPGRGNRIKQLPTPSQIHVARARLVRTERMTAAPRAAKGRTHLAPAAAFERTVRSSCTRPSSHSFHLEINAERT